MLLYTSVVILYTLFDLDVVMYTHIYIYIYNSATTVLQYESKLLAHIDNLFSDPFPLYLTKMETTCHSWIWVTQLESAGFTSLLLLMTRPLPSPFLEDCPLVVAYIHVLM